MQRKLVVEFTKMNGAGNDFVVIDNRFFNFTDTELAELARRFCPRRVGIGADGLLAFSRPRRAGHHYRMRYVNADGSFGTMCGNGARCLARFALTAGFNEEVLTFETDAGVFRALAPTEAEAPVRLFVEPPKQWTPDRPVAGPAPAGPVHYIWTGTEHAVCFVEHVAQTPVADWGPSLRHDQALQPTGANIDFVEVIRTGVDGEKAVLRVRTYEKGVEEETLACGTGAMASAVAARLLGRILVDTADVIMPGGVLSVGFRLVGEDVHDLYLEGPAEAVFRGTVEI